MGSNRCRTILILLGLACFGLSADEDVLTAARRLSKTGHRPAALELLRARLVERPTDVDCGTLYGAMLSWDGRYDEAREALQRVLERSPGYYDALSALVRVELWSDHPDRAEQLADEGLKKHANDTDLLLLKVRALRAQKRSREAATLLHAAFRANPEKTELREQWQRAADEQRVLDVGISHSNMWFSDGRAPWREEQVSLSRLTPIGSVIGRMSFANRFETNDRQAEIDFYPRIRPGTYGYLNAGWSPGQLYPHYRLGAELYQSLGHGWEGSAGFRQMNFSSITRIYTFSATRYYGDWMFTARTFLTPDSVGTSRSIGIEARRYFGDGVGFIGVRCGYGASPTEITSVENIDVLNSASVVLRVRQRISRRISVDVSTGVAGEDRVSRSGLRSYTLDASFHYRF